MSNNTTKKIMSRVRAAGMQKAAAVLSSMPPRQRLLLRVCMTKNAGLLGSMCKTAFDWDDALDKVHGWMNDNPRLSRALIGAGTGATLGGVLGGWKGALAGGAIGGTGGWAWGENVAGKKALELAKRDAQIKQDEAVEAATSKLNREVRGEATAALEKQKQDMTAEKNEALVAQKAKYGAEVERLNRELEDRDATAGIAADEAAAQREAELNAHKTALANQQGAFTEALAAQKAEAAAAAKAQQEAFGKERAAMTAQFNEQVRTLQALVDQGKVSLENAQKAYEELKKQYASVTGQNPMVRSAMLTAARDARAKLEEEHKKVAERRSEANKTETAKQVALREKRIREEVARIMQLPAAHRYEEANKLPVEIRNGVIGGLDQIMNKKQVSWHN